MAVVFDAELNDDMESNVYRTMSHYQTHNIVISNDDLAISLTGTREQVKKIVLDLQKSLDDLGW